MRHVIAIALLVGACRGKEEAPAQTAPPPSDGIEMVKLGDPPQRLLRYHLAKGTTSRMEIAMDYQISANERVMKLPTLVLGTELTVDDVHPDGTATTHSKIIKAEVRETEQAVTPGIAGDQAQRLLGITFRMTLSPGGHVLDSGITNATKVPADLKEWLDTIEKNLRAVAMPLPDVPVGVGAQWKHRATVNQTGIHGVTITTVDLVTVDNDKVTYMTSTSTAGADQHVESAGQTIDVKHVGGGGNGRGTVDLARLAMNGELTMSFHAEMTTGDKTSQMKATTKAVLTSPDGK